jgi:secreted trypsin-like serine protease
MKTKSLLLAAALAAGCTESDDITNLEESTQEVIGGIPAYSHNLDAVGALGVAYDSDGDGTQDAIFPFCTGTLIAPTVVLTAEHCVDGGDMTGVSFLVGHDANAPDRVVPALAAVAETTIVGGQIGLGSDVAIVHLAEPVNTVPTMIVAPFPSHLVGQRFTVLGYGVQDNTELSGTRLAGALTLRGTTGRIFEHLFGSFAGFLATGVPRLYGFTPTEADLPWLQEMYDTTTVLDGYEATLGDGQGDANDCYGDSGGPLIKKVDGSVRVVGVVSWGYGSTQQICDFGGVFGALGPASIDFIEEQLACPLGSCEP